MLLNRDKCQFMLIGSSRNLRDHTENITIDGNTIIEGKMGKLLGITFDNQLTMNEHIKHICKQASNKLYALARISHFLSEQKRKF